MFSTIEATSVIPSVFSVHAARDSNQELAFEGVNGGTTVNLRFTLRSRIRSLY